MTPGVTPGTTADALVLRGVSKSFGGVKALSDVDLTVRAGEVLGLIGPNGAGKSTLFEVASGNLAATAGTVHLFGQDVTRLAAHRRRRLGISRTFQKVRLFSSMTVRENIAVAALECRGDRRTALDEVDGILERLHLTELADRRPAETTLADRKRVEIGRAMAGGSRVLLLDEAMCGLTQAEADRLVREILLLNTRDGITVVVVEHVMSVLVAMVTRLVVLQFGAVIADGTPAQVAADPVVRTAYLGRQAGLTRPGLA